MEELHAACDKLYTEVDHLELIVEQDQLGEREVLLALSVAKRVRTSATLVTRALARIRDELQTQEVTSHE